MIPARLLVYPLLAGRFPSPFVLILTLLAASSLTAPAQVTTGAIVGTVYDASDAVLPNATITATNLATGATRQTQSNNSGYYTLPSLPPSGYKVTATAQGFQTADTQLEVALSQTANFEFHLNTGSVSQNIEVDASGSTIALETTSHELGSVVSSHSIENLPSNGGTVFQTCSQRRMFHLFRMQPARFPIFEPRATA